MSRKISKKTIISVHKPVEFPVINSDDLVMSLDVETLAKQSARENKPLSSSSGPDSNELKFQQEIETKSIQAAHRVKRSLSNLRDSALGTNITIEFSEIAEIPMKFKGQISSNLPSKISLLKNLEDDYRQYNYDINHFKKTNLLRRTASYPESNIFTVSLLILAMVIESMLNGVFFAEGSDAGLIGGTVVASVISLINITLGFFGGVFILRYKNHASRIYTVFAWIGIILLAAISLVFNFLVGHYREALGIDPDTAHKMAVEMFMNGMLNITDVQSWLLILMGLFIFVFAVFKGYKFDDEYPKYGKICRERESLKDEILAEKYEIFEEIDMLHSEYDARIDAIFEDVKLISNQLNSYISSVENQKSIYHSYTKHLQSSLNYLITFYRDINTHERSDPAPSYFQAPLITNLINDEIMVEFTNNRDELISKKNELATSIPKIKSELLVIKESFHNQIIEACKL